MVQIVPFEAPRCATIPRFDALLPLILIPSPHIRPLKKAASTRSRWWRCRYISYD